MRIFVAAWPDDTARTALRGAGIEAAPGLRVVPAEQWHVTLRFLGSVEPDLLTRLVRALGSVAAGTPPSVARLGPSTDWFGRGAVLQVPVAGLDDLAAAVRAATDPIVPAGDGAPPFVGHVTLARGQRGQRGQRGRRPEAAVRSALSGRSVGGEFAVESYDLVVSEPRAGGHRYRTLERFPLEGAPAGAEPHSGG